MVSKWLNWYSDLGTSNTRVPLFAFSLLSFLLNFLLVIHINGQKKTPQIVSKAYSEKSLSHL